MQQADDPSRFVLLEVYRSNAERHASTCETAHYHAWLGKVEDMMAEPRTPASSTPTSIPPTREW